MNRSTLFVVLLAMSAAVHAVDGVILIGQSQALAGNVTPGDAPGFPITISKSGSYKLTADLVVPDLNTNGIVVTAPDVTIDLNGFGVRGPNSCTIGNYGHVSVCAQGNGHGVSGLTNNITVRNGTVKGMGGYGVKLWDGAEVEGVMATHNGENGIDINSGLIRNCRAIWNGGIGIFVQGSFTLGGSLVKGNKSHGVMTFGNGLVTGNSLITNGDQELWVAGSGLGYSNNVIIGTVGGYGTDLGGNLVY